MTDLNCSFDGKKLNCTDTEGNDVHLTLGAPYGDSYTERGRGINFSLSLGLGSIPFILGIWFVISLIIYGDLMMAIMFTVFTFCVILASLLFLIPIVGIILFILATNLWEWYPALTSALGLPIDVMTGFVFWFTTISFLIIGIIISVIIILVIISFVKE